MGPRNVSKRHPTASKGAELESEEYDSEEESEIEEADEVLYVNATGLTSTRKLKGFVLAKAGTSPNVQPPRPVNRKRDVKLASLEILLGPKPKKAPEQSPQKKSAAEIERISQAASKNYMG